MAKSIRYFILMAAAFITSSCSPYRILNQDQVDARLILVRMDRQEVILLQCENKTNIAWPNVRIIFETKDIRTGGVGPTGSLSLPTHMLKPHEILSLEHEAHIERGFELSKWQVVSERSFIRFARIILIGSLMVGGILLQLNLKYTHKDDRGMDILGCNLTIPKRVIDATGAASLILAGVVVQSIIYIFDPQVGVTTISALFSIGKILFLVFLIISQSYLNSLTLAWILSCCVYYWLMYGELHKIPLIQTTFEWALGTPGWVGTMYVVIVVIYSLFCIREGEA